MQNYYCRTCHLYLHLSVVNVDHSRLGLVLVLDIITSGGIRRNGNSLEFSFPLSVAVVSVFVLFFRQLYHYGVRVIFHAPVGIVSVSEIRQFVALTIRLTKQIFITSYNKPRRLVNRAANISAAELSIQLPKTGCSGSRHARSWIKLKATDEHQNSPSSSSLYCSISHASWLQ